MVYLFGILGFIGGFALGLMIIGQFLRGVKNRELIENRSYRWTYGVAVWVMAAIGAYVGVWMHGRYFIG